MKKSLGQFMPNQCHNLTLQRLIRARWSVTWHKRPPFKLKSIYLCYWHYRFMTIPLGCITMAIEINIANVERLVLVHQIWLDSVSTFSWTTVNRFVDLLLAASPPQPQPATQTPASSSSPACLPYTITFKPGVGRCLVSWKEDIILGRKLAGTFIP